MHLSSLSNMKYFCNNYLKDQVEQPLNIYDIGSCDVNGSYHDFFDIPGWSYTGVDLEPGKNVDLVLNNPYRWNKIKSCSADVVISGQALEHVEFCWLFLLEIRRILRPGGLCCIIAPSAGFEHRFPVDCYRFYTDGFRALARFSALQELEIFNTDESKKFNDTSSVWKDTVFIGRKPIEPFGKEKIINIKHLLLRSLSGV